MATCNHITSCFAFGVKPILFKIEIHCFKIIKNQNSLLKIYENKSCEIEMNFLSSLKNK